MLSRVCRISICRLKLSPYVYIFPVIYTPTIIYKIGIGNPTGLTYFIVILSEFILISLYNIQDQMEYPFDKEGLDDIDLDLFKMHRE
jgi:predicted membrane chloride channel (bestrophin family)